MLRLEDVVDRAFTRTHLREGYEVAEVDEFCFDVVEAISSRDRLIGDLQEELAKGRVADADGTAAAERPDSQGQDSSSAAARVLEMAADTADQLVAEAKAEASSLVSAAQAEAERLVSASRSEADRVTAELEEHRTTVLAEVADRRAALEAKVESLRRLEDEHRKSLRHHFAEQLARLDDDAPPTLRVVVLD